VKERARVRRNAQLGLVLLGLPLPILIRDQRVEEEAGFVCPRIIFASRRCSHLVKAIFRSPCRFRSEGTLEVSPFQLLEWPTFFLVEN
jgi:hypothetical protein